MEQRSYIQIATFTIVCIVVVWALIESSICVFQLFDCRFRYFHGSFINSGPCACFISATLLCSISLLRYNKSRILYILTWIDIALAAILIPLSLSRTAILASFIGFTVLFWPKIAAYIRRVPCRWIALLSVIVLVLIIVGFVFIKPMSAYGRWFIWRVALSAWPDVPLTGVGWDSLEVFYNEAQERFFLTHPDAVAEIEVASSSNYLFNEFLSCFFAYGIIGGMLAIGLSSAAILTAINRGHREIAASLSALSIVMCGSYPLHCWQFIILYMLMFTAVAMLLPLWQRWLAVCVSVCLCGVLLWNLRYRYYGETLYAAISLHDVGRYIDSNIILNDYLVPHVADVRVLQLLGRNYEAMEMTDSAEYYYIKSHLRVPSRHYPHYLLMRLYDRQGRYEDAECQAKIILMKQPKVSSRAIDQMRYAAARYLYKHELEK